MKYNQFILAGLFSVSAISIKGQALEQYEIRGTDKKASDKVYLLHYTFDDRATVVDSTTIVDEQFVFRGQLEGPGRAGILFGKTYKEAYQDWRNSKNIFIDLFPGLTSISFKNDTPIIGKLNEGQQLGEIYKKMRSEARQNKDVDPLTRDTELLTKFISAYPKEKYSLHLFSEYMIKNGPDTQYENTLRLFKGMDEELRNSRVGKKLLQKVEALKFAVGTQAPNFSQKDQNGKLISLADYKGKFVLLDFWASWCAPCRKENPNLLKAYQQFHGPNFDILAISLDSNKDAWAKAIIDDQLAWTHVSDLKGWKNEVALLYGIRSVPSNIFIDPNGKIIAKDLRGESLTAFLKLTLNN